jgi:alpha,alpha-trehalose phosphorylase
MYRGRSLLVQVNHEHAIYSLLDGEPLEIGHHGQSVTVSADKPLTLAIPAIASRPAPRQPPGREPVRRTTH